MEKYTNALADEPSLYLQQHAHNPVDWMPWGKEAFEKAKAENKLVLVSIGYSACHWCHVMEHECFEDEEVAALMNKFFVSIKVDREERPDVDQVYMNAVQLMTQRGGWPLNCFTLPDGRPIYGGTYFPKDQWMHVLRSLHHMQSEEPEKVESYAHDLTEGIAASELISAAEPVTDLPEDKLPELVRRWMPSFDTVEGGPTRAPKFPLPNNYLFLLHYAYRTKSEMLLKHVHLTLDKMAMGGIHDQLGGGFARYSTDMLWKVPHFEKMLYDNGQLLSLYAQAYRYEARPEYLRVMEQMLGWLEREMLGPEGGLFAAQDADSEGVEGKFYVWNPAEIKEILGKDADWYLQLYNPYNKGFWEDDQWILLRNESYEQFIARNPNVSAELIDRANRQLFDARKLRVHPVTDTKCLTAWNAMTVTGLVEAYRATAETAFLSLALKAGKWIRLHQLQNGRLFHTRQNGRSFVDGMLDDYAFAIEAYLELYQVTGDDDWLTESKILLETVMKHFFDEQSGMFWFTPEDHGLIARKMELHDNVIPSTNGVMAHNLLTLSIILEEERYEEIARQQLQNMLEGMEHYGSGHSNWALLLQRLLDHRYVVHVHGKTDAETRLRLQHFVSPQIRLRYVEDGEQAFALCGNGLCYPKTYSVEELEKQIAQYAS
jgi:uncharacterized protein